jgi:hypothetical protein
MQEWCINVAQQKECDTADKRLKAIDKQVTQLKQSVVQR